MLPPYSNFWPQRIVWNLFAAVLVPGRRTFFIGLPRPGRFTSRAAPTSHYPLRQGANVESTHGAIATLSATTGSSFIFTTKSTKDTKGASEDISLHAVFEFGDIKVEHETCLDTQRLHVGEDLRFMDQVGFSDTFQLDDQCTLDQQVDSITTLQRYSLIFNGQGSFTGMSNSVEFLFSAQTTLLG